MRQQHLLEVHWEWFSTKALHVVCIQHCWVFAIHLNCTSVMSSMECYIVPLYNRMCKLLNKTNWVKLWLSGRNNVVSKFYVETHNYSSQLIVTVSSSSTLTSEMFACMSQVLWICSSTWEELCRFLFVSTGKPVMIITEYMENGSLDSFLRVGIEAFG